MESYRELVSWREAMALAKECYLVTRPFPTEERYGLTSQIRRAAVSVPANIAEGYGRATRGEYIHFLHIAQGSLKELETHLLLSEMVECAPRGATADVLKQCDRVGRLLRGLIAKLREAD